MALNTGGPQFVDASGTLYQADSLFTGGTPYATTAAITGTTDDVLYQSERYGNFSYAIPLTNGDYVVTLRFAEIYWAAAGMRVFDVIMEGKEVISNLDLFAKVGKNAAYDVTIPISVTDGTLEVHFRPDVNNAKVSAITVATKGSPQPPANTAPVAKNDTATTAEDTAVTIAVLANDTDANDDTLTITAVTPGANGTVVHTGTTVTYTPKADSHGTDAFTYTVSDGKGGTVTGNVSVTVTPVNDTPLAYNSTLTTAEDTSASGTLSASDVDKEAMSYQLISQGSRGTVTLTNTATGAYTYSPQPNLFGTDTFTFHVSDGKATSSVATVAVTITPINDVPVAVSDTVKTAEDKAVTITVLGNDTDADGDPLTITAVTPGANGTVVHTGTAVTYTPKRDFHGTDAFTYTVSDSKSGTATGQVSITVTAVNDTPVAHNGTLTTPAATKTSGTLSASDVDKDTLTYQLVSQGSKGTITLTNTTTGAYTYRAKPEMTGTDTFTFRVSDGKATSNTATVTVTIMSAEAENVVFAVNAGGPRYVDAAGTLYEADTLFSGGSVYTSTAPIAGTDDDVLYQSERYGNFAYAIPVPNGNYVVTLQLAEIYWAAAGQRVFDVLLEGQEVVSNLDLVAKVGRLTKYDVKIPVQVSDEELNIQFRTDQNNAKVSAIVVETSKD